MFFDQLRIPALLYDFGFKENEAQVSLGLFDQEKKFRRIDLTVPVISVIVADAHSQSVEVIRRAVIYDQQLGGRLVFCLVGNDLPARFLTMKFVGDERFLFRLKDSMAA